MAESFFSSLKTERIKKRIYKTRELARADIFDYIEMFCNRVRRHSHLGGVSPEAFEAASQTGSGCPEWWGKPNPVARSLARQYFLFVAQQGFSQRYSTALRPVYPFPAVHAGLDLARPCLGLEFPIKAARLQWVTCSPDLDLPDRFALRAGPFPVCRHLSRPFLINCDASVTNSVLGSRGVRGMEKCAVSY